MTPTARSTTGLDTINSLHFDFVNGTAGGFGQTLTNGDKITGNPNTTVNILVSDPTFLPGVATISNVGMSNVAASNVAIPEFAAALLPESPTIFGRLAASVRIPSSAVSEVMGLASWA